MEQVCMRSDMSYCVLSCCDKQKYVVAFSIITSAFSLRKQVSDSHKVFKAYKNSACQGLVANRLSNPGRQKKMQRAGKLQGVEGSQFIWI